MMASIHAWSSHPLKSTALGNLSPTTQQIPFQSSEKQESTKLKEEKIKKYKFESYHIVVVKKINLRSTKNFIWENISYHLYFYFTSFEN